MSRDNSSTGSIWNRCSCPGRPAVHRSRSHRANPASRQGACAKSFRSATRPSSRSIAYS
jgi:hypothetical protein